ncbi:Transcription factor [Penicillium canescens]|nr:Transcription factor [Penicillium canescens]
MFLLPYSALVQLAVTDLHASDLYDHPQHRVVLVLACHRLLMAKWSLLRSSILSQKGQGNTNNVDFDKTTVFIPMGDDVMRDNFS